LIVASAYAGYSTQRAGTSPVSDPITLLQVKEQVVHAIMMDLGASCLIAFIEMLLDVAELFRVGINAVADLT
jgi:hypothetical protein